MEKKDNEKKTPNYSISDRNLNYFKKITEKKPTSRFSVNNNPFDNS